MKKKLFENINRNTFKVNEIEDEESDMANPEEKREVQIGKEIIRYTNEISDRSDVEELKAKIVELANELIQMHGQSTKPPYAGSSFLGGGHGGF